MSFGTLPSNCKASHRLGLVDDDISGGTERLPVPAVNDVAGDKSLPPCTRPSKVLALRAKGGAKGPGGAAAQLSAEELRALDVNWVPALQYTARLVYAPNVPVPPATTLGCACVSGCDEDSGCGCAALNPGRQLPYILDAKGVPRLPYGYPVIHECGPACACPPSCPNRLTQQGLRYRLEVFRTPDGRGWGVRSWDTIPPGAYVASFNGLVIRDEDAEQVEDDTYLFNMRVSSNRPATGGVQAADAAPVDEGEAEDNRFVIDAGPVGGVARFINHSCAPNLFVQPVLGGTGHRDEHQAMVTLFSMEHIPPLTELTYDYGPHYVETKLEGKCMCGAGEACVGASAAAGPFKLPARSSPENSA